MPINPIVNDTFTMGFIFVPVGLEPQVRVWGASRPPPGAESREANEWQRPRDCPPPVAESRAIAVCAAIGERGRCFVTDEDTEYRKRTASNAAAPTARRTPHHRNRTPAPKTVSLFYLRFLACCVKIEKTQKEV